MQIKTLASMFEASDNDHAKDLICRALFYYTEAVVVVVNRKCSWICYILFVNFATNKKNIIH
jgi:hypothetical protein